MRDVRALEEAQARGRRMFIFNIHGHGVYLSPLLLLLEMDVPQSQYKMVIEFNANAPMHCRLCSCCLVIENQLLIDGYRVPSSKPPNPNDDLTNASNEVVPVMQKKQLACSLQKKGLRPDRRWSNSFQAQVTLLKDRGIDERNSNEALN